MTPAEEWLASRPECVQALAKEFPMHSRFQMGDGPILYLCGYTEDDHLIVSPLNPWEDYERAISERFYLCASRFR